MTHAFKSLMYGEHGKDRIEYALLKYMGAQPDRTEVTNPAAANSAEPGAPQTAVLEQPAALTVTASEPLAGVPAVQVAAPAADASQPAAGSEALPVPAQSLDASVRQILEQAEQLCAQGRYAEASALIDKAEAMTATAAVQDAQEAAPEATAEPAPESGNVEPNLSALDSSIRSFNSASPAEVSGKAETAVPEIPAAPASVAEVPMAAAAAAVGAVVEAPIAHAAPAPVAEALPVAAAVAVAPVVEIPLASAPAIAPHVALAIPPAVDEAPVVEAPVAPVPEAMPPAVPAVPAAAAAVPPSKAAEPAAVPEEEKAPETLGPEEPLAARIASDIAKGLANVLAGAIQHLERHVTGESRRLTSAFSQRLDKLQASVESLQPLRERLENLVQAETAVQEKYEQLAATTASLQQADAQRAADIGALRAQVRELSSSSLTRVDEICRRIEGQERDIANANSTFSELAAKFAAAAGRLERHAEAIRSLHHEHTQRSAALDQIADALTRLRTAPVNGQPLAL